ncbi:MAG: hypothetical protein M3321_12595, partial [Actinomycetota bacterium]|nr:hypothetical protein [Actinomycetota bacterium]
MIRTAAVLVLVSLVAAGDAPSTSRTTCPSGAGPGRVAYLEGGALLVLQMPACSSRVLVRRSAAPPVRWSADGQYLAFGGGVVHVDSGRLFRGLRGSWSPRGHTLATISGRGGLVLRGPGLGARRLLSDGFGAQSVAFDRTGTRLAVGRARPRGARAPANREIWVVDVRTRARRLVYRAHPADPLTPVVRGWAPGGFVVFSRWLLPGSSANLDGLPLLAVSAAGGDPREIVDAVLL